MTKPPYSKALAKAAKMQKTKKPFSKKKFLKAVIESHEDNPVLRQLEQRSLNGENDNGR